MKPALVVVTFSILFASACAKTNLAASDFDTRCTKNSDCVVVLLGDECNRSCDVASAVNVSSLDDVQLAIDQAHAGCFIDLNSKECTAQIATLPTCNNGTCAEKPAKDANAIDVCGSDAPCIGSP